MSMENAEIVKGCRRRDSKAQRALYDSMAPMVFGVCRRFACCRSDAQDLMQDVFIKVFEHIRRLDDAEKLKSWIYSTAVNTCIDHYRRERERILVEDLGYDVASVDTDPYAMEEILEALQRLTPMLRTVFNLCDVEGLSTDEAAKRLGSSSVAVRVALSRARKELKEQLTKGI